MHRLKKAFDIKCFIYEYEFVFSYEVRFPHWNVAVGRWYCGHSDHGRAHTPDSPHHANRDSLCDQLCLDGFSGAENLPPSERGKRSMVRGGDSADSPYLIIGPILLRVLPCCVSQH